MDRDIHTSPAPDTSSNDPATPVRYTRSSAPSTIIRRTTPRLTPISRRSTPRRRTPRRPTTPHALNAIANLTPSRQRRVDREPVNSKDALRLLSRVLYSEKKTVAPESIPVANQVLFPSNEPIEESNLEHHFPPVSPREPVQLPQEELFINTPRIEILNPQLPQTPKRQYNLTIQYNSRAAQQQQQQELPQSQESHQHVSSDSSEENPKPKTLQPPIEFSTHDDLSHVHSDDFINFDQDIGGDFNQFTPSPPPSLERNALHTPSLTPRNELQTPIDILASDSARINSDVMGSEIFPEITLPIPREEPQEPLFHEEVSEIESQLIIRDRSLVEEEPENFRLEDDILPQEEFTLDHGEVESLFVPVEEEEPEPAEKAEQPKIRKQLSASVRIRSNQKDSVQLPLKSIKSILKTCTSQKLSSDILTFLQATSDEFLQQTVEDLEAYAAHAKRKTIDSNDVVLLMKRNRIFNDDLELFTLAHDFLPLEYLNEVDKFLNQSAKRPKLAPLVQSTAQSRNEPSSSQDDDDDDDSSSSSDLDYV